MPLFGIKRKKKISVNFEGAFLDNRFEVRGKVNDPILETRYLGLQNDFKTNEIKLVYKQY